MPSVAGVHIMAPGNDAGLAEAVAMLRCVAAQDEKAAQPSQRRRDLRSLVAASAIALGACLGPINASPISGRSEVTPRVWDASPRSPPSPFAPDSVCRWQ